MPVDETFAVEPGGAAFVPGTPGREPQGHRRRRIATKRWVLISAIVIGLLLGGAACWISFRIVDVKDHLSSAASLASQLRLQVLAGEAPRARNLLYQLQHETQAATAGVGDPMWKIASDLPLVGENFMALSSMAEVADSVVSGAGVPLLDASDVLSSGSLTQNGGGFDLALLSRASSGIVAAAQTTDRASSRLETVDRSDLLGEISRPLNEMSRTLREVRGALNTAAEFTAVAPDMLGSDGPRNYLVLVQNNAELRSTGGLSGALAVVRIEPGKAALVAQATATEIGKWVPPIAVDREQELIFSTRLGSQINGVNLTPDFPTAAQTAKIMWEARLGTPIDGVVSIDPVVLSHILTASGPVPFDAASAGLPQGNLPSTLNAENVVKVLLSDPYTTLNYVQQDQFFAAAARQIFDALTTRKMPPLQLIQALTQSAQENRLHVWSPRDGEQRVLAATRLGGSMSSGPDAGPGSFGVFFNDGTGSKMDYYVRQTVQLIHECPSNGDEQATMRIKMTSTAPADAATSLPEGVTGGGLYGVPAGLIQTNIVVYGPPQANVKTAKLDGITANFAPYRHGMRPVGVVTTRLGPGETRTLELTFSGAPLQAESNVVVTPTVQDVKEVILNPSTATCAAG